jgi:hypothetical protein
MQQHQQALSNAIPLIAGRPKPRPLTQDVGCPNTAAANGLIDTKLDLDYSIVGAADRQHLPREDNVGLVRQLMQNIERCL